MKIGEDMSVCEAMLARALGNQIAMMATLAATVASTVGNDELVVECAKFLQDMEQRTEAMLDALGFMKDEGED